MTGYVEVDVLVEGALDAFETFTTKEEMDKFVARQREAADNDGARTEVFVFVHDHPESAGECLCGQFATDHSPAYVFPEG